MLKRILPPLLVLSALSGCAVVPGLVEEPKVSVQHIALQDISLTSGTARVTLGVYNPNPFMLPLEGVEYQLRLNNKSVADGEQNQELRIGAGQEMPLDIPVKLNFKELLRLLPDALRHGEVQYNLTGAVRLPLIKVPFQRQGSVGVRG